VHLLTDLIAGSKCHKNELKVLGGIKHATKITIFKRSPLNVIAESSHLGFSLNGIRSNERSDYRDRDSPEHLLHLTQPEPLSNP